MVTATSEMIIQFYRDTAVGSITGGFINTGSYGGSCAITQSNRERRIYRRWDTRYINWLDSQDSLAVLPVFVVDTLYEMKIRGTNNIELNCDIREVGGERGSYVYTSADTPYA